jgi:CRISPR system Cascade subunit CasE
MYLSRLILNPRSHRVQRELAEPYEMHRSLMKAFPPDLVPGEERVLFRVDEHPRLGLMLLVQSWDAPDWTWLAEDGARGYLLAIAEPNPAVKPFDLNLAMGQSFIFRLRANPTKRLGRGAEKNASKRIGRHTEDEQFAWLARKGEQHGFRVLQAQVSRDGKIENEKAIERDGKEHKLELLSVRFDGVLQVTDPDKLIQALQTGIGSAKGFGFGLLSLASAPG